MLLEELPESIVKVNVMFNSLGCLCFSFGLCATFCGAFINHICRSFVLVVEFRCFALELWRQAVEGIFLQGGGFDQQFANAAGGCPFGLSQLFGAHYCSSLAV